MRAIASTRVRRLPAAIGSMDWEAIGRRAIRLRQEKGWTQAELARRAHVSANTVRGLEHGSLHTRWPKLEAIVSTLGTTVEALAKGDEPVATTDPRWVGLKPEDLTVARNFHDASTAVRQRVLDVLQAERGGEEQPEPPLVVPSIPRLRALFTAALTQYTPVELAALLNELLDKLAQAEAADRAASSTAARQPRSRGRSRR
jgi:transcriptional regulator with XRE-family HTH domain